MRLAATLPAATLAALLGLLLAAPAPARAYDQPTHVLLTSSAVADLDLGPVPPSTQEDLAALRRAVWDAGAHHADAAIRARFLARCPDGAAFDAWALKALLGLTPEATVIGLDVPPADGADGRAVLALGSRAPDDDRRNQDRYAHAPDRSVRRDAWGRPLPADPAQLHMGKLSGLSSQAHAHYGLPRIEHSQDPAVLEKDPRRFSVPKDALTFADEFAQVHTDLALAAATLDRPGAHRLSLALLGQGEHYLEDLANQIHTLQAVFPFFVSAKLESLEEDVRTLGGVLGPRRGFLPIGIQIISNHHLFVEALWSGELRRAAGGDASARMGAEGLAAARSGDLAFSSTLDGLGLRRDGPFAFALADALADASSREGGDVYLLARTIGRRRLSSAGYEFKDGGDPAADLDPAADAPSLAQFWSLQVRGFGRGGSAVRRHVRLYKAALEEAGAGEAGRARLRTAALERLISRALAAREAGEARLAAWTPSPPPSAGIAWGFLGGLAAALAGAALLVRWLVRRRRARRG
jgi:hypothetical protein